MPLRRRLFGGDVGGIVVFATGYALVDALPLAFPGSAVFLGLRLGDLADVVFAFVLVALYVRLGLQAELWRTGKLCIANAVALVMLVQGHSVHLAANAIAAASQPSAGGWDLIYFLDEHWGHTELHLAFLSLAALFIGWARPAAGGRSARRLSAVERAGLYLVTVAYGLWLAADAAEGQTVPLMLPAGLALFLWGFWPQLKARLSAAEAPVTSLHRAFFAASFGIATAALLAYGIMMHGFPEPFGP